ncbi:hypothetical protein [Frigidibacter sp. ROC022]|uniref:hypothetical protein n=1 Tax=Frigidibacter sp. ROC022 TaxID=2971796 RepID=UPI00215B3C70|nr:hypothetical protein [Frigidibacter sp. ROC022]MCR8725321.1 hypothetical protein [Frigidibacter sp. ROC022]
MTRALATILALVLAAPANAEPMSGAEFEAYVTGRTLTYNSGGTAYGIEQYLKNRRVRWAFLGDDCVEGSWYEDQGMICFTYENNEVPQCWTFEKGSNGLIARFQNDPAATELYEARQSSEPMICLGPKVGV